MSLKWYMWAEQMVYLQALASITPRSQMIKQLFVDDLANSKYVFSICIIVLSKFSWNLYAGIEDRISQKFHQNSFVAYDQKGIKNDDNKKHDNEKSLGFSSIVINLSNMRCLGYSEWTLNRTDDTSASKYDRICISVEFGSHGVHGFCWVFVICVDSSYIFE